jgi:predicted CxxxxCH...CXXCH cytochrome family protein
MGNIVRNTIKGMSLTARMALISAFTLLLTIGWFQVRQNTVDAAIVNSQAWSSVYSGTAFPGSYTYTVPAGSDRLLVVAVQSTITGAATQTCSVTWGGKPLTQATGNGGSSGQAHTFLFYLKEADIAAATGSSLAVSVAGGTTSYNMVRAAVYTGVDQINTIAMVSNFFSATAVTTIGPLSPNLTLTSGQQAVEIINLSRTGSTTSRTITPATPWSNLLTSAVGSGTGSIGVRNYLLGDTTAGNNVTSQYTASGSTLAAISAMVIAPKVATSLSVAGNIAIAPTGHRLDSDAGVVMQRLDLTSSGQLELSSLTMANAGTSNVIANAEIYLSPTAATVLPPDAVLVGSAANWSGTSTSFPLTGGTSANRTIGGSAPATKSVYIVYDFTSGQATKTAQSQVTAVGVVAPNNGLSGQNLRSNVVTLDYSGNQLQVQASSSAGASTAKDSDVAVVMQHFPVNCDSAFDNALQVNSVTVQDLGTIADPNTGVGVAAVKIYVAPTESADATVLPSGSVLVGQLISWNKSQQTITLTDDLDLNANQGVARTVFAGTPKYIYIVYAMYYRDNPDYFANPNVTVQSKVTAVGVSSPDVGTTGLNYLSNVVNLTRGTWSKITNCGSCHETTNIVDWPSRAVVDDGNGGTYGRFPGSHTIHTVTYDCNACHAKPSLTTFNHSRGFIGFSSNLRGDKYSRSSGDKVAVTNAARLPGSADFGTCSNTKCHGQGSPIWSQVTGVTQCQKCHADQSSATFYSTANPYGTVTDPANPVVGAHDGHTKTGRGYSASFTCNDCHTPVAAIGDAGHMSGAVNFNTAKVTSYDSATKTCTSTCHSGKSVVWNNTAYLTGTVTDCSACHGLPPATSIHSGLTVNGSDFTPCVGCHSNLQANGTFINKAQHVNGRVNFEVSGSASCIDCHSALATMTSDTSSYHHVLASTSPDYSGNTCLKCHVHHNVFQADQNTVGAAANLRVDNGVAPTVGDAPGSTYTNTDFVAGATNGGICTSCHNVAIAKNTTAQKFSADINTTTMVVTKAQYAGSLHNYTTSSTFNIDNSKFLANCTKCHNDTLAESKQAQPKTFGLHLSATRELFSPLGATTGQDAREGLLCFGCHSTKGQQIDGQTQKAVAGKDWYGSRSMRASAEDTFTSFSTNTRIYRHNTGKYAAKHKVTEDQTYLAANKHVECADCHNSHAASYGNHTQGSATLAAALTGATGVVPTYSGGVAPVAGLPGVTGTSLYFNATAVAGAPASKQTTATITSPTWTTVGSSNTAPTSGTATAKTISVGTGTSGTNYGTVAFVSQQMAAGTIAAQTVTFNVYALYAGGTTAPRMYAYAYLWNGSTATPLTISTYTTLSTTNAVRSYTITMPQTVVTAGTVLVAEVYAQQRATTPVAQTVTLNYNATGNQSAFTFALTPVVTWATASSYTPVGATQEYQICYKCHTGANTSYASWGGTGAAAWTDLALEFNPNNASRHPIGTPLAAGDQLTAARLAGGWTPGQVMNCTDCHATDSTASKGPHGSSVKWMLSGANKAWPYTTAAGNGGGSGTLVTLATYNTNAGTTNGLFCLNCHTVRPASGVNGWHSNSNLVSSRHNGTQTIAACAACHIRVPHGGKISRLLQTTNAPARYRANGSSGTPSFTKWGATGTSIKGTSMSSSYFGSSCGEHSGTGGEAW